MHRISHSALCIHLNKRQNVEHSPEVSVCGHSFMVLHNSYWISLRQIICLDKDDKDLFLGVFPHFTSTQMSCFLLGGSFHLTLTEIWEIHCSFTN